MKRQNNPVNELYNWITTPATQVRDDKKKIFPYDNMVHGTPIININQKYP